MPFTRTTMARVSCTLSGITVLAGLIALFSNHWIENETMHVGFLSGCSGGVCTSTSETIPDEYRTPYTVVILLVYIPLVLIFVTTVLQVITVWKGPSKRRDVSGTVLAWLSGYHSLLLTVFIIAAASMIPSPQDTNSVSQYDDSDIMSKYGGSDTMSQYDGSGITSRYGGSDTMSQFKDKWTPSTDTVYNDEHILMNQMDRSESASQFQDDVKMGWSAYFGLLAAILSLASAVSSSLYFGMDETEQLEDTIPLQPNAV